MDKLQVLVELAETYREGGPVRVQVENLQGVEPFEAACIVSLSGEELHNVQGPSGEAVLDIVIALLRERLAERVAADHAALRRCGVSSEASTQ